MQPFEYKVVPAPRRGKSGKGVRGSEAKFAHALSTLMNELGADGWEYIRADTLPVEERSGLTSRTTVYHNMLVFRRPLPVMSPAEETDTQAPLALPRPLRPAQDAEPTPPDGERETTGPEADTDSADPDQPPEPDDAPVKKPAARGDAIVNLLNARRGGADPGPGK